jgi:hypothetical protein
MMKIYKLLFLCLLVSGCMQSAEIVSTGDKPDWLSGEPRNYPNVSYLYATGSASKAELAKDRALGNLAKIFELQVRESSTTSQDVKSYREGDQETVTSSARIASQVNISTDKMIQGARVAEQWQDEDDLTYYALAVLDRSQAGANISDEMNRLDREIAFTMTSVDDQQDPLIKIADLQNAINMQNERNALQQSLKVVDLQGRGKSSSWNVTELKHQQTQALRALSMKGIVTQDSIGELERLLHGAMAHAGFEQSSAVNGYTLASSMVSDNVLQKEGWYWLRGTLNLQLVKPDGTVMGNKSWPLKVSAVQQGQLDSRMRAEVDAKLKKELKNTILEFATGGS